MIDPVGTIPQSSALSEASAESLSELMSRDPEGYTRIDRDKLVATLRAQRAKWEAAEASGVKPRPKKTAPGVSLKTTKKAEDLGL